jgi:hypothetical protein
VLNPASLNLSGYVASVPITELLGTLAWPRSSCPHKDVFLKDSLRHPNKPFWLMLGFAEATRIRIPRSRSFDTDRPACRHCSRGCADRSERRTMCHNILIVPSTISWPKCWFNRTLGEDLPPSSQLSIIPLVTPSSLKRLTERFILLFIVSRGPRDWRILCSTSVESLVMRGSRLSQRPHTCWMSRSAGNPLLLS